jgi:hypothetical protein
MISMVPKEEGSKSQHMVIQLNNSLLSQSLEPNHQIPLHYFDANSEVLHLVLVFVPSTWFSVESNHKSSSRTPENTSYL